MVTAQPPPRDPVTFVQGRRERLVGQYTFPVAARESVLGWVTASLGATIRQMERFVDTLPDSTWHNYLCSRGNSVALLSISDHVQLPGKIIVTVSTDLRRIWRLTRLVGDVRLSLAIARLLRDNGGVVIEG